jgi:hypothetical protein
MTGNGRSATQGIARDEVLDLARQRGEPAVSVLLPVDQPVAAHPETVRRLEALTRRAVEQVRARWGPDAATVVAARFEDPECRIDARQESARGLALFVTPSSCTVLRLPFPVEEQVVVHRTFATRQLFAGLARTPRARVLVLDGADALLYEAHGSSLVEAAGTPFPLHVETPREWDTPHSDRPIHEEVAAEQRRVVHRAVDAALDEADRTERLPVVVAAPTRELAAFDEVTRHGERIVGRIHGNVARTRPAELASDVLAVLTDHRRTVEADLVGRVREAVGQDRAVVGLVATAEAVRSGRGHLLVLEDHFRFPILREDVPTSDAVPPSRPEMGVEVEDLVDDLIEATIRNGGDVEFVEPGALADLGHVGVLLRY